MTLGEHQADHVELYWDGFLPTEGDVQAWNAMCPIKASQPNKDQGRKPYGQLTLLGAQELVNVGASLRSRYD